MTKIKVAIIDDEAEFVSDLARGLELFGYEVVKAVSGARGIEVIEKDKPDVVLCDYKLEDMDGTQVIEKARPHNPAAAYIIITAYYDEGFRDTILKAGADDVIYKPVQLAEIHAMIKRSVGGKAGSP